MIEPEEKTQEEQSELLEKIQEQEEILLEMIGFSQDYD
jgi:uncharacterized protein YjgD (DUF1641 family)